MKLIHILFMVFLFSLCVTSCRNKGWTYYKGICDLLLSSGTIGKYYVYDNGKLNLKTDVRDIVKKSLPDIFLIQYFDFYNGGILVIANKHINNEISFDNLALYFITDHDEEPQKIMEININYNSLFYIYENLLFCYNLLDSKIIAIDIEKREILWEKELGDRDITVKNIFVDMELQICVLSSHNYYIHDKIQDFIIIALDNPIVSKSFQGILLDVNITDKLIYYFDYENGIVSYNYKNKNAAELLRESEFPDVTQDMMINQLYVINKDEYIICFIRETKVFLVELLFPKSGASLPHYTYFTATLNDEKFEIMDQIKFGTNEFEHTHLKRIQKKLLPNEGDQYYNGVK